MSLQNLSEQEQIRRASLEDLRKLGINPYPAEGYPVNAAASQIKEEFKDDDNSFGEVFLAGRIMSRRIMGAPLSLKSRMLPEGSRSIFSATPFARKRIKPCTIRCLKNCWISVISLA